MQECQQCGKCCEQNGPTLHIEDKYLVTKGIIPPSDLITLRKGEKAFDPRENKEIILENEIIKIKGSELNWECKYYNPEEKSCTIYSSRPAECRLLKCWDPKPLLSVINKNLLTREMLFSKIPGFPELIQDHEEKCSFEKINSLLKKYESEKNGETLQELKEAILFDINIREILSEKQPSAEPMLQLIFGRELTTAMEQFKYKIRYSKNDGLTISPFKLDKILDGTIS
ncbi:MAG: YkgJ family cysteine cluster protein [Thermodesulfobacteriota bacterium]